MMSDDYEEYRRSGRYPWEEWFADDRAREIYEGTDYQCATATMRVMLIQNATKRGLKVRLEVYRGTQSIAFRAYRPREDGRVPTMRRPSVSHQAAESETGKDAKLCEHEECKKPLKGQATHLHYCSSFPPGPDGYINEHTGDLLGW